MRLERRSGPRNRELETESLGTAMEMKPCKPWTGAKNRKGGYGVKRINGKPWGVHRLIWFLEYGSIPSGLSVLHKCDNPACWEIEHLFLGTQKDNCIDMVEKGRHWSQKKLSCPKGHGYTSENTRFTKTGARYCLECKFERYYESKERGN